MIADYISTYKIKLIGLIFANVDFLMAFYIEIKKHIYASQILKIAQLDKIDSQIFPANTIQSWVSLIYYGSSQSNMTFTTNLKLFRSRNVKIDPVSILVSIQ